MPDPREPVRRVEESKVVPKRGARLSLVWIVPIVAALAGAWVAVTRVMSEGPSITIVLNSAEGLEAGKTKIRYNGVEVGTLTEIRLSPENLDDVIAIAQMVPKSEKYLVEDTHFWVVRPRISGSNVSGLGTLVSGAYIGMEIGGSKSQRRSFVALKTAPVVAADVAGRSFVLKSADLGSLSEGTPVFFRRLQVGEVTTYRLNDDGSSVSVTVFVNSPYDEFVTADTRFWHASGVDASLSATGISVRTQSVLSILVGGIAFESPSRDGVSPPAATGAEFPLFNDRADAFAPAARDPITYGLRFDQSVRGLSPGAPVEFRGIQVGEVAAIDAHVNAATLEFSVLVTVNLEMDRFGVKLENLPQGPDRNAARRQFLDGMVARGLRAQLNTGSILTGALFVALDIFPNAPAATVDWSNTPPRFPTTPSDMQAMEASVANIVKKVNDLPMKEIAGEMQVAIRDLNLTLVSARNVLDDAGKMIAPSSTLAVQLDSTLQEMARAAAGFRVLADYLERHPEALLRGKTGEAK